MLGSWVNIVGLAAQGLINAEIGRRLFMSAEAAKVHLHHVFVKLGVTNRAELAAQAAERRIGPRGARARGRADTKKC